jgi:hypothetical protein
MAAAHVPLRRRGFSLRDSHCGTFKLLSSIKIATILRLFSAGKPRGGGPIVANRGSYSEWSRERKACAGRERLRRPRMFPMFAVTASFWRPASRAFSTDSVDLIGPGQHFSA